MDTSIAARARADRPNSNLAIAVDQTLVLAMEQDIRAAARFLTDNGAGFALTCRVLAEPGRRRAPHPICCRDADIADQLYVVT